MHTTQQHRHLDAVRRQTGHHRRFDITRTCAVNQSRRCLLGAGRSRIHIHKKSLRQQMRRTRCGRCQCLTGGDRANHPIAVGTHLCMRFMQNHRKALCMFMHGLNYKRCIFSNSSLLTRYSRDKKLAVIRAHMQALRTQVLCQYTTDFAVANQAHTPSLWQRRSR